MSIEEKLIAEMDDVLKQEIAQRHSYFQLKYFVIGKEPTVQSKMWQCLRELKSRKESLDSIELEIEESKDKLELIDISIQKNNLEHSETDKLTQRENEIKIRQIERQKKALQANQIQLAERKKWIYEEAQFFLETFKNLLKVEPLKHFDDITSQKQYWTERLSQKLNLKMLTNNQLDTELIETIIALPDDMPIKKQTLGTLELRHASMVNQLKLTMQNIKTHEEKQEENKVN
jgi:hypothetical protein